MSVTVRRLFYLFYVLLFLLVAPVVVLYTAGYRYQFATKQFVQTGALSVTSLPRGATVFLNDEEAGRTPLSLKRAIPGTYQLRLEKEGYHPWQREVDVRARATTILEELVLFLETEPEAVLPLDPSVIAASPDTHHLAYGILTESWFELWLYDRTDDAYTLLDRASAALVASPTLTWSTNGTFLHLDFIESGQRASRFYSLEGPVTSPFEELTSSHEWLDIRFDPLEDGLVHLFTEDGLVLVSLRDQTVETIDPATSDVLPSPEGRLVVNVVDHQWELARETSGVEETIALLPDGTYRFRDRHDGFVWLEDITAGRLMIIDTATSGPPILLNTTGTVYDWNEDVLLYGDGYELHQYIPATNSDLLITRTGERFTDAVRIPFGNTVLMTFTNRLVGTDFSDRSRPVFTTLVDGAVLEITWLDDRGKTGYLFGIVNDVRGLFQLPLTN